MKHDGLKITGILLAGGMSTRMGKEKGMVKLGNHPLYEYPLKVLESTCDEILISTCNSTVLPVSYPMVCDELEGIGPMGGIYTCLKYSSNELNIILSYDMPGVNEALIKYLISERDNFDMLVPALRIDRPEPLCGLYRKNALNVLEDCIQKKVYAVHKALHLANSKIVMIEERMSFWTPYIFHNINRVEDVDSLPSEFGNAVNET